jgi:hypothetical protein
MSITMWRCSWCRETATITHDSAVEPAPPDGWTWQRYRSKRHPELGVAKTLGCSADHAYKSALDFGTPLP